MKTAGGYPVRMRAGALAVVALVAAALGAAAVLVIGSAAGWVGDGRVETVVVVDPGYVRNSPRVAGYYGQAGDFHYRNYYGTPRPWLGQYLPYACVLEALC